MKKVGALLFLFAVIALVGKGWHLAKGGFAIARIRPFYLTEQKNEPPPEEIRQVLRQTFHYLSRGRQCYAFASADGKYVLKLPRFDHFRVPFWLRATPFFKRHRETLCKDKQKRHQFILGSFQLADEELKEETALLYVHLGESHFFQQKILLVDRVGRAFSYDLDKGAFLVQEKKPLMMPLLLHTLEQGDREKAKEMLDAFLALIAVRARKGIFNKDPTFYKNFGYEGGRMVQIDVGSFYRKGEGTKASFQETVKQFQSSLQDPEILSWFEKQSKLILEGC